MGSCKDRIPTVYFCLLTYKESAQNKKYIIRILTSVLFDLAWAPKRLKATAATSAVKTDTSDIPPMPSCDFTPEPYEVVLFNKN